MDVQHVSPEKGCTYRSVTLKSGRMSEPSGRVGAPEAGGGRPPSKGTARGKEHRNPGRKTERTC